MKSPSFNFIARAAKPLVAVVPLDKYQTLQRDWDDFFEGLAEMSANVREQDYERVDRLVDEAVRVARKPKTKK